MEVERWGEAGALVWDEACRFMDRIGDEWLDWVAGGGAA
jgi:hypothetical protein